MKWIQRSFNKFAVYKAIKGSGLFDEIYYLISYPDVRQADMDPVRHFISSGAFEGRNPNRYFDTAFYLNSNPDVNPGGINPLYHYIRYGEREGRRPNPDFDPVWYLEFNVDVKESGQGSLWHYFSHGSAEGRAVNAAQQEKRQRDQEAHEIILRSGLFDEDYYLEKYPDLPREDVSPIWHYLFYGATEMRDPSPFFHTRYYTQCNPDVLASGMNPLLHYIVYGRHENRLPNCVDVSMVKTRLFRIEDTLTKK